MSNDRSALVMAPASNLNNVADIIAAANGMRLDVLDGLVTAREMLRRIGRGEHEVVFFGGHGDDDSLAASDGPLDENLLRQALREASAQRLQIVVLNSCFSLSVAAMLYRAGVAPRVIGWPGDVSDEAAGYWAKAFFRSLAMGVDYWEAFASSVEVLRARYPDQQPPELLNGRISLLEQQVAGIKRQLDDAVVIPRWMLAPGLLVLLMVAVITTVALFGAFFW